MKLVTAEAMCLPFKGKPDRFTRANSSKIFTPEQDTEVKLAMAITGP